MAAALLCRLACESRTSLGEPVEPGGAQQQGQVGVQVVGRSAAGATLHVGRSGPVSSIDDRVRQVRLEQAASRGVAGGQQHDRVPTPQRPEIPDRARSRRAPPPPPPADELHPAGWRPGRRRWPARHRSTTRPARRRPRSDRRVLRAGPRTEPYESPCRCWSRDRPRDPWPRRCTPPAGQQLVVSLTSWRESL